VGHSALPSYIDYCIKYQSLEGLREPLNTIIEIDEEHVAHNNGVNKCQLL